MHERKEHGGNLRKIKSNSSSPNIIDFSANINPLGAPDWLRAVISRSVDDLIHYPDVDCLELRKAISSYNKVPKENIVCGNGTAELMYVLLQIIDSKRIVIPVPSYVDYKHAAENAGKEILEIPLLAKDNFNLNFEQLGNSLKSNDFVILATPNNPTGSMPNVEELKKIIIKRDDVLFCLDEAFIDFIEGAKTLANFSANVITLNSMTKFFAVPGLRLGYICLPESLANKLIGKLPPWSVNTIAQNVGIQLLKDECFRAKSLKYISEARADFISQLKKIKHIEVFPSAVNFYLCKLKSGQVEGLDSFLVRHGIAIRNCANYVGLDDRYFRIAVRTKEENIYFIDKIKQYFGHKEVPRNRKKTPSLMLQGTCSNAGKSVLTAAFCRILNQDGFDVAPFKAQNMSLNSYVTVDGGEMGRAQVVQAQAARLLPDWRMNPILLKPNSDTGSQVIINGQPVGNMDVLAYHRYKTEARQKVKDAYDELSSEHQIMVLEGAGSPGEVNLKAHDIVNMRMAQYAKSPVLIVGDIDRGGVYASFVGVMEVLEQWERDLVGGFLVNRFRGDASLLSSAHGYVTKHTGKDVLGVVPYLSQLGIPEEDSVSFKSGINFSSTHDESKINIGVLSLPHIANFTDIEPFEGEADVQLQIINSPEQLSNLDCLIIPGTKNVLGDLEWLKLKGFTTAIDFLVEKNITIVGICGGYQILGQNISDPHSIESQHGNSYGLGLLDINTEIMAQKQLVQRYGIHKTSNHKVSGYEIHHGITTSSNDGIFSFDGGYECGSRASQNDAIWGAYLHGMFDEDIFRRWFINSIRQKKDWSINDEILHKYDLENSFNRLADVVRKSVDMDDIYKLIGV